MFINSRNKMLNVIDYIYQGCNEKKVNCSCVYFAYIY